MRDICNPYPGENLLRMGIVYENPVWERGMHKIGVISDTHGLLRPEVMEKLKGCDVILHGGDINKKKILDELELIAPVYAVRGNNDKEWAAYLPETLALKLFNVRIFITHNKKMIPDDRKNMDLIIYGHSHKYEEKHVDGICYLNPGSCGPRRFTQPITLAVVYAEEETFRVERIDIAHGTKEGNRSTRFCEGKLPQNIREVISTVMRETSQGKTVKQIAKKHKLSEELVEQICRLYLTHPGVNEDGIMKKMGI